MSAFLSLNCNVAVFCFTFNFSGRPPDFLAFVITLLMMLLLAAGVKKSLIFNNVLNAINLAVWVFIMGAGMFYVNSDNWSQHNGFLPYGWSGVRFVTCLHFIPKCNVLLAVLIMLI